MGSLIRNLRGVLVFACLSVNTLFWFLPILPLAIVKLLVPLPRIRSGVTRILMSIGEHWISGNRLILRGSGSMDWQAEGVDELRKDGWYLVLSNHQTWVDVIVLQTVFNRRIPFLKFFIKKELIWFPVLGIAWWALDMPFMKRHSPSYLAKHPEQKGRDLTATKKACAKFAHTPTSVINFVEGTRFTEQKRDARKSPYEHLLTPRAGGVAIALASMGELFDGILDVTVFYRNGVPKFWSVCCGDRVSVKIEVRMRSIEQALVEGDYQNDRNFRVAVHRWLGSIWLEKDRRLGSLKHDSQLSPGVT